MKCIKNIHTNEIRRVSNDRAEEMVDMGERGAHAGIFWTYIKKEVWKKECRDPKNVAEKTVAVIDAPTDVQLRKIEAKKEKKNYQKARKARTNN